MRKALIALIVVAAMLSPTTALGQGGFETNSFTDNSNFEQPQVVIEIIHPDGIREFEIKGPAEQRETGVGGTKPFYAHEAVVAFKLELDNGLISVPDGCYLAWAPTGGTATDGKVNPYGAETVGKPACEFQRKPELTGEGGTKRFEAGVPVVGAFIRLDNGQTRERCYMLRTPTGGSVTSGVIWPLPGQIVGACSP